jgi:hypothetical protein|tara:strand:- start:729 stop:1169 length:441 start_codon:yes stop_codon:yes gene_type:complete
MSELNMKSIVLTRAEALFLDDTLTVMTDRETMSGIAGIRPLGASAMMAAPPDLIDRIGMAVLLTTSTNAISEAVLVVDDQELYLLRECAQSSIKFDDEPVGFNLKRKIYLALLEDSYTDSLQFAKLMVDMETDSTVARQQARENFT